MAENLERPGRSSLSDWRKEGTRRISKRWVLKGKSAQLALLCVLIAALSGGCARETAVEEPQTEVTETEKAAFLLKLASTVLPESSEYQDMASLKSSVEHASQDGIDLQIYPGSQLGEEDVIIEGMRTGTIEMALLPLNSLEEVCPQLGELYTPFADLFTAEELEDYGEGAVAEFLSQIREETGIRVLALVVKGKRNIWTKKVVGSVDGLNGLRLYVMAAQNYQDIFTGLGIKPVDVRSSQIFDGLEADIVDGAELEMDTVVQYELYNSCKYCLESEHGLSIEAFLISEEIYQQMDEELRVDLETAVKDEATIMQERIRTQEEQQKELLKEAGVIFYSLPGLRQAAAQLREQETE